jgi:serine phosphatase RsbU (regulator of sigma subunit)
MRRTTLFRKSLLLMVILFGVIATATSVLSAWNLYQRLTSEYRSKGIALARILADTNVESLFNASAATLQATIDQCLGVEGVAYVFVVDAQRTILAHTFVPQVPRQISLLEDASRQIVVRDLTIQGIGDVIDVAAPVLVGVAGYVHIGMDKAIIRAAIWSAILRQQLLILVIFFLSIVLANLIVKRISRPLEQFTVHVSRLATHDFSTPVAGQAEVALLAQRSTDEIGELATAFLSLESALQQSIAHLKETTAAKERIESELKIARDIQMSILPRIFPPFPQRTEFDLHATIEPAYEVGGDFYDFFLVDDEHLCFAIGDVSGKGVPASLFMAITQALWRVEVHRQYEPDLVLTVLNKELCRGNESCMFVTVFCGVLHLRTGEVQYSNGGHTLPYRLSRQGSVQCVENTGGMALGVKEDATYARNTLRLSPYEGLFLYTDGVTEAMDADGELFSEERLQSCLQSDQSLPPVEVIRRTLGELKEFVAGAEQSDDITTLAIRFLQPTGRGQGVTTALSHGGVDCVAAPGGKFRSG